MDMFLSVLAFSRAPLYFYLAEANRNFAEFLAFGAFPTTIFVSNGCIIFIGIYHYFCIKNTNTEYYYKKKGTQFFLLAMLAMAMTRISAGLTWFGNDLIVVDMYRFLTLFILIYYIYIINSKFPKTRRMIASKLAL